MDISRDERNVVFQPKQDMNHLSAIVNRRWPSVGLFPLLLAVLGVFLLSCNDSGVDSDTAHYVVGDGGDSSNVLPDLQKAYIEAGIVGEEGNALASDFVNFRRVTEYSVDTLPTGRVQGLRDLHLKALFGDPNDAAVRHNFYPLRELQFRLAELPAGSQGSNNLGRPVQLENDPDSRTGAGLKALFVHDGISVTLVTAVDDSLNRGYAYISSVDPVKRTVGLHLEATLTNPLPYSIPNRIVDRMVVTVDLQLPY